MKEHITKDSGERVGFDTGMVRDTEKGKPRMDLCVNDSLPFGEQLLVRYGLLRARGAEKYCETYTERNCEKAETLEELHRFRSSAARHFFQWMCDEQDEDHAAATLFNLDMAEMVKYKLKVKDERENIKTPPTVRPSSGKEGSGSSPGHRGVDSLDAELQEHEAFVAHAVRERQKILARRDEKVSE